MGNIRIEKIKAEMADYLHGLNSCAEIDYSIYSQLFDFSLPLIQKAYELGKKEARQEFSMKQMADYASNFMTNTLGIAE